MSDLPDDTHRVIPGVFLTAFGLPVSIELNRGVVEIFLGNPDPLAEGERIAISPDGSAMVRVAAARSDGTPKTDSLHHPDIRKEPDPVRHARLTPWHRNMTTPLGDREIHVVDPKSPEGRALLGETGDEA